MSEKPPKPGRKGGQVRDWHLWSQVTRSVTPLNARQTRKRPATTREELQKALNEKNQPNPASPPAPPKAGPRTPTVMPAYRPLLNAGSQIDPGREIEPGLKRRLVRGHLPIDATLDLHGLTQAQAHATLNRFLPNRAAHGDRTILVITGKGVAGDPYDRVRQRGVLRHMVPHWLREPQLARFVAGVEPAHKSHGGEGALYVRLKKDGGRTR